MQLISAGKVVAQPPQKYYMYRDNTLVLSSSYVTIPSNPSPATSHVLSASNINKSNLTYHSDFMFLHKVSFSLKLAYL